MIEVLYCDNHLLAVNKPAGLVTQPTRDQLQSLQGHAQQWIKKEYNKPGKVFLEPVHRIDKPVSGIVLFARTSKSLSRCMASVREKKYRKEYLAVCEGIPKHSEGSCESYLLHGEHRAHSVKADHADAKKALLIYSVLKTKGGLSLLKIAMETGRYHQIRIQLAELGHPILGDRKYGSKREWLHTKAIALHHSQMDFPHPTQELLLELKAPLPPYWPQGLGI